jgi:endonuclease/exonuclease/phosphatase (EEP) superfamily protein YafD
MSMPVDPPEVPLAPRTSVPQPSVSWSGLVESAGLFGVLATLTGFLAPLHWTFELTSHFRVQLAVAVSVLALISALARRRVSFLIFILTALMNLGPVLWSSRPSGIAAETSATPLRLLSINVHTDNRRSDQLIELVQRLSPDVLLLMEVDNRWMEEIAVLRTNYPTVIPEAREDNFGIALLSRVPLRNTRVEDLEGSEVPSITTEIQLPGRTLHLLGTHPVPPGKPDYAQERNRQLAAAGAWAGTHPGSAVILGDLNTTPWSSYFTELLRAGRLVRSHPNWGLFATWKVSEPWFHLPLDHCLVSPEIAITRLEVGPEIGSDHRPLIVELAVPTSAR